MKQVFGIANSNIVDVAFSLKRLKPRTKLFVYGFNSNEELDDAKIYLSNMTAFKRVHKSIPEDCVLFIVDTAINLKKIKDIVLVDSLLKPDMSTEFFSITDDILRNAINAKGEYPHRRAQFKKFDIAEVLLRKTPVSVLSKIFTFLYSIANKEKRDNYRHAILYWLVNPDLDEHYLVNALNLKGKGKRLLEFLLENDIVAVRTMFEDSVNYKDVLKANNISVFDYNYLKKFKAKDLKKKGKKKKPKVKGEKQ